LRIAITGGAGFIGRRVLQTLAQEGHEISVLSRSPARSIPAQTRYCQGDLISPDCPLAPFLEGCDVIIHCAGEIHNTAAMRPLHVGGTQRLLEAALREAIRRATRIHWVQLSSVGAYGPPPHASMERVVTEEVSTHPVGEYEISKTLSDELVIKACMDSLLTYSIVRPSNVFASDMPNNSLRALGAMIRRGLFFYIGRPGAVATYVHVDDVVETVRRCAFDERARGGTFNLSNDCLLEDMIGGLAGAIGVQAPRLRLPEALVRSVTRLAASVVRLPLTQERVDALVMRTRYPYFKLERQLGFTPRIAVPAAVGQVVLPTPVR
jgi:nucleoside-diphosphate-sugar epimerase